MEKRERTNKRTNDILINEGNGISTILFYIQPSGQRETGGGGGGAAHTHTFVCLRLKGGRALTHN